MEHYTALMMMMMMMMIIQGVNTGVLLLDLAGLRASPEVARLLQPGPLQRECERLHFSSYFGDQDWWNLLLWTHPGLRHPLDCGFNFQTSQEWNNTLVDTVLVLLPWNNGKEVPRWGVAEIQKMSPSTTGRCK